MRVEIIYTRRVLITHTIVTVNTFLSIVVGGGRKLNDDYLLLEKILSDSH